MKYTLCILSNINIISKTYFMVDTAEQYHLIAYFNVRYILLQATFCELFYYKISFSTDF